MLSIILKIIFWICAVTGLIMWICFFGSIIGEKRGAKRYLKNKQKDEKDKTNS
jgi:hypothetical protein